MSAAAAVESPPGFWRRLYEGWLLVAAHFGEVQTLVLVTLIYGVAIGPASIVAGALRRDLLAKRGLRRPESAWDKADTVERPDLERARRLF